MKCNVKLNQKARNMQKNKFLSVIFASIQLKLDLRITHTTSGFFFLHETQSGKNKFRRHWF